MTSKVTAQIICPLVLTTMWLTSGCGLNQPASQPDSGPLGRVAESKANLPLNERFLSPPVELYDLEAKAGIISDSIIKENWWQAQADLTGLLTIWEQAKPLVGEQKGIKEADEAITKLSQALVDKSVTAAYENLNKFMSAVADLGKLYKLSPLTDIISVDNSLRSLNYFVEDKNWRKAEAKAKELENVWNHSKPSLEKLGILNEIKRMNGLDNQIKDSVKAENKNSFTDQAAKANESLGRIRDYYRNR